MAGGQPGEYLFMSNTKKFCTVCGKPSIPGLLYGKCQYHYNLHVWGKDWADKCEKDAKAKGVA